MLRIVRTENGMVEGLPAADPRITSFKGIPFAAPPVGENRWRAPQPAEDWDGILCAYSYGPISMQRPQIVDMNNIYCREWAVDPDIPMDEDCLYLNVWTPALCEDENLPVYVWYFGGGLQEGHPSEMEFDGERLARRGIIVVTVNYRTNVFGFLCHKEITREQNEAPANFGHLDQQAGLKWVKRNIRAFGGDPDNVTIGGQSAGGGSVLTQITAPSNDGLIQRAVIDSGIVRPPYPTTMLPVPCVKLSIAEEKGERFFAHLGVQTLKEARELDAVYIRDKMMTFPEMFGTVDDGVFCIGDEYDLLFHQKARKVPLFVGNTKDEFCVKPQAESMGELKALAQNYYGEDAQEFLTIIQDEADGFEDVMNNATINSIAFTIHLMAQYEKDAGVDLPIYYYTFQPEIPGWDHPGCFHSVDLWFFFETLAKCWRPFIGKHYDLSRQMCNYITNFIKSGDPNGDDSTGETMPIWKPYTVEQPWNMEFGEVSEFKTTGPDALTKFLIRQYRKK